MTTTLAVSLVAMLFFAVLYAIAMAVCLIVAFVRNDPDRAERWLDRCQILRWMAVASWAVMIVTLLWSGT
jgi:hypothetical protein